ncbi:MAG: type I-E CRISPR-associated protein Cas6/Cse3/CasE [Alphaproteobacteria bacterium]|nr:type I-E CRISPR-associated protein Cas6/Cse3/CasE [Alphaproteobacteria bacterium]
MYISRLTLRTDRAGSTGALIRLLAQSSHAQHHDLMWSVFGDRGDRRRDFLYRVDSRHPDTFIAVSARAPEDVHGLWRIETKDYAPQLVAGQQLAFSLRANPTVRSSRYTVDGKSRRHDVVMHAKGPRKVRGEGPRQPEASALADAGLDWLTARSARFGSAIAASACRVAGYLQHRIPHGRGGRMVCFSSLDFDGVLTVIDPDLLCQALYRGIGSGKAFGCGLLLVKRP